MHLPLRVALTFSIEHGKLSFLQSLHSLNNELSDIQVSKIQKIGELPEKGEVKIKTSVNVIDEHTTFKNSPFDKTTINNNREFIKAIKNFDIKNFSCINSYFKKFQSCDGDYWVDQCIRLHSIVIDKNNNLYEPSEGERTIISASGILENSEYDCYLFDEIETGLGNKYITEYVIPKINHLRKLNKTIVLSTHNANIAVNTSPAQTILCNYIDCVNDEIYYCGNMYDNKLKSVFNRALVKNWDTEAIMHLEGGDEMFKRRKNIWKM